MQGSAKSCLHEACLVHRGIMIDILFNCSFDSFGKEQSVISDVVVINYPKNIDHILNLEFCQVNNNGFCMLFKLYNNFSVLF